MLLYKKVLKNFYKKTMLYFIKKSEPPEVV